ncbi:MAG: 50S ribosomal protein L22 [Myxococcota bacterium]
MEVRASLNNIRMAPRKGRAVADLVRDRLCADALTVLETCPRGAAKPISKLLRSALANAQEKNTRHRAGLDLDNLYVKTITVDEGPRMWRIKARAMGRASWINKATSHITIVLAER